MSLLIAVLASASVFLPNRTVVSDTNAFMCGSAPSAVLSADGTRIFASFLTSRTGYGESHDVVALAEIPVGNPSAFTNHVICQVGETFSGIPLEEVDSYDSFPYRGKIRNIISVNGGRLGWRDWDPDARKVCGEGLFACRLSSGAPAETLVPETLDRYLDARGFGGHHAAKTRRDSLIVFSHMQSVDGALYGTLTSSLSQPVVFRCEDGETLEFVGVVPALCQYECALAFVNGRFYALGRAMPKENFFVSDDGARNFRPVGRIPDGEQRPQLAPWRGKLLIGHSASGETPTAVRNGRNNLHLLFGEGGDLSGYRELTHAIDPLGIVYYFLLPADDGLHILWSDARRFPDKVIWGAVQGKDRILYARMEDVLPASDERTEELPLFFNVAPFSPGREKTVAEDMRQYVARTGNRRVLYSLTLHPEGRPALAKVEVALESYRALKRELSGSDVRLGILLQAILGHWPRTDRDIEPWQRTIDENGEVKRFCWLDPGFRDYIRTVARKLAVEKPDFILGDDDIRAFSPEAECFCPLHVAEFNRRRGTDYTAERMRTAVKAARPGDPDFETFMALQREYVNGVCALIREGIDSVDPSIPSGTCMPGWELRFNDGASRAIAAKGQRTLMRLANGNYHEWRGGTLDFLRITQLTQSCFAYHRERMDDILAEADTYPHHLWSRSATGFNAHLTMCLFTGLRGAKLWLVNAHKGALPVSRAYTDVLAENAGRYRELCRALSGAQPVGFREPCLTNFPAWHPVNGTDEAFVSRRTWATRVLGRNGVPFTCGLDRLHGDFWTLSGRESVRRLSDGDLRQILAHRVLVDGVAAVELTRRGFADLIGVRATDDSTMLFNDEVDARTGLDYRLTRSDRVPRLESASQAKVLTHLAYRAFNGDGKTETVAPGVTVFDNALGGRIAVSAFHLDVSDDRACGDRRNAWLRRIVDALDPDGTIPLVANQQDVAALASRGADGALLLAVFNLNFDPLKELDLRLGRTPRRVAVLQGDGEWRSVTFAAAGRQVRVPQELPCYGSAILRIECP